MQLYRDKHNFVKKRAEENYNANCDTVEEHDEENNFSFKFVPALYRFSNNKKIRRMIDHRSL